MTTLTGRNALITGAAGGGIGTAVARALAQAGAGLALHYHTSADKAQGLADELAKAGGRAVTVQGDLATPDGPVAVCEAALEQLGPIDILVNSAGGWVQMPLLETSVEAWDGLMHTDLRATFLTTRTLAPAMIERGWGRIINLSSVAAQRYLEGEGPYGTAKAGIDHVTRSYAVELAPHGITVNAIAPALTLPADKPYPPRPEDHPECGEVPNRRPGHAREVAALVRYLVSEEAGHVTGQVLAIDGGLSVKSPKAH